MISSIPNFFCCITKHCRNKVMLKNESNYVVKYEAYIYRGASVGKIDTAIGAGGFNGKTALEIIQSEGLKPEVGRIAKKSTVHVTCGYGGKIAIRYYMIGLHTDYTDEFRNFQVLDVVNFTQPDQDEKAEAGDWRQEERERKAREEERKRKAEEEEAKRTAEEEEAKRKEEEVKRNIKRKCSTTVPRMCSASDTPKRQCPYCGDWYCNYHHHVNNGLTGGGHYCNGKTQFKG